MSVEDRIGQAQGEPCAHRHTPPPAQSVELGLLDDCARILAERGAQYGPPSDHHARTAQVWSAVLGWDVAPRDVAVAFTLDKLVRMRTSPGLRDSYADAVGYLAIAWGHQERSGE